MELPSERPLVLTAAFALIGAASRIVPTEQRARFEHKWQTKLLGRWQFLFHTGFWDFREAVNLATSALGVLPDAIREYTAQEYVRNRINRVVEAPFSCLAALMALLLVIGIFSGGLPATRDLLFKRIDHDGSKLVYVWTHNLRGGGDRPLPAEVVDAWRTHSQLISEGAAFRAVRRDVQVGDSAAMKRLVITTEPSFFKVTGTVPLAGSIDTDIHSPAYVLLSYEAWTQLFHASPTVMESSVTIAGKRFRVRGVLPQGFQPLSREMAIYVIQAHYYEQDAYAVVKAKPGVNERMLDREFSKVTQDVTYYFLNGLLRFGFAQTDILTPLRSFLVGTLASVLMLLMVFRFKWRALWPTAKSRRSWVRQAGFFAAKLGLGLACVFTACLEWSRSSSAILVGNFDPGSGPFLLWLYILGTMGVLFWAVFDQKSRCRECLQLLAFAVRMGSPGNLFLDWSGIELCCGEGHGVLHVPYLAPSWVDESAHWIALDESWTGIFSRDNRK